MPCRPCAGPNFRRRRRARGVTVLVSSVINSASVGVPSSSHARTKGQMTTALITTLTTALPKPNVVVLFADDWVP